MGWAIAYLVVLTATSVTLAFSDIWPDSWQWWVIILSVILSNVFGRAREADL